MANVIVCETSFYSHSQHLVDVWCDSLTFFPVMLLHWCFKSRVVHLFKEPTSVCLSSHCYSPWGNFLKRTFMFLIIHYSNSTFHVGNQFLGVLIWLFVLCHFSQYTLHYNTIVMPTLLLYLFDLTCFLFLYRLSGKISYSYFVCHHLWEQEIPSFSLVTVMLPWLW